MTKETFFLHESSFKDHSVQINSGTKVWQFCNLMKNAKLGTNCIIGQNCMIGANAQIGNNVKIQNNVSIYDGVIIEDDVFIGPSVVFTNVLNPRSFIERKSEFKKTVVHQGATLGANSTIICGVEIGRYALIGAGSVVTKNVPNYALVYGNPAKVKGFVSIAGNKLTFCPDGFAQDPFDKTCYFYEKGSVTQISTQ